MGLSAIHHLHLYVVKAGYRSRDEARMFGCGLYPPAGLPVRASVLLTADENPVRFRKISFQQVDPERVTLSIVKSPNGRLRGVVTTGSFLANETPEIVTSLQVAAAIARSAASYVGEDVDVVDEENLWRPTFGELELQP